MPEGCASDTDSKSPQYLGKRSQMAFNKPDIMTSLMMILMHKKRRLYDSYKKKKKKESHLHTYTLSDADVILRLNLLERLEDRFADEDLYDELA